MEKGNSGERGRPSGALHLYLNKQISINRRKTHYVTLENS